MATYDGPGGFPVGEPDRGGRGDSKSNDSRGAVSRKLPGKLKPGVTVDDVKNRKK
jgi:hypothetical protein